MCIQAHTCIGSQSHRGIHIILLDKGTKNCKEDKGPYNKRAGKILTPLNILQVQRYVGGRGGGGKERRILGSSSQPVPCHMLWEEGNIIIHIDKE